MEAGTAGNSCRPSSTARGTDGIAEAAISTRFNGRRAGRNYYDRMPGLVTPLAANRTL